MGKYQLRKRFCGEVQIHRFEPIRRACKNTYRPERIQLRHNKPVIFGQTFPIITTLWRGNNKRPVVLPKGGSGNTAKWKDIT